MEQSNLRISSEQGYTEVVIDADCGFDRFYAAANNLQAGFNVTFTDKVNHVDTAYWDFQYNSCKLVLHYNIFTGLSIFPFALKESTQTENDCVSEIGNQLFDNVAAGIGTK